MDYTKLINDTAPMNFNNLMFAVNRRINDFYEEEHRFPKEIDLSVKAYKIILKEMGNVNLDISEKDKPFSLFGIPIHEVLVETKCDSAFLNFWLF